MENRLISHELEEMKLQICDLHLKGVADMFFIDNVLLFQLFLQIIYLQFHFL